MSVIYFDYVYHNPTLIRTSVNFENLNVISSIVFHWVFEMVILLKFYSYMHEEYFQGDFLSEIVKLLVILDL